jgi:ABC-type bacteriocin/lantibiotic exporter with double-glycine peptidase domain
LVKAARRFGFSAQVIDRSDFRTMAKWLRREVPVIVDWMSTVSCRPMAAPMACGHYSVVCALGSEHIVLQDPAIGRRRRLTRAAFQRVWFDFEKVFPKSPDDLIIRRLIVISP